MCKGNLNCTVIINVWTVGYQPLRHSKQNNTQSGNSGYHGIQKSHCPSSCTKSPCIVFTGVQGRTGANLFWSRSVCFYMDGGSPEGHRKKHCIASQYNQCLLLRIYFRTVFLRKWRCSVVMLDRFFITSTIRVQVLVKCEHRKRTILHLTSDQCHPCFYKLD